MRFQVIVAAVFAFILGASEAAPQNLIRDISALLQNNPVAGPAALPGIFAAQKGFQDTHDNIVATNRANTQDILTKHRDQAWGPCIPSACPPTNANCCG